jgi:hypothetical protein
LLLRYPQRKKYCHYGHSFCWILKCRRNILWVKTKSLFLKHVSTAKVRCSTDQRSMATEMRWVSLEGHSRTNSPRQRFHSQLFCKIVRYFCRTLYKRNIFFKMVYFPCLAADMNRTQRKRLVLPSNTNTSVEEEDRRYKWRGGGNQIADGK